MPLKELQNLLARLYVDAELRERFFAAPEEIGGQNGLDPSETEQIARILPDELKFFAESLFHKRLHEVEKLLPLTRKALGDDFNAQFRTFAAGFASPSLKKHLADAIRFAAFVQENISVSPLRDLAAFERARLESNGYHRRFIFRGFLYDIREVLRIVQNNYDTAKINDALRNIPPRRTFAVWICLRKNKNPRSFIW